MSASFWKDAANSLPPQSRHRYAAYFERAERFEHVLDAGISAWRMAKQGFASGLEVLARGFRTAARRLDSAAHRVSRTR